MRDQREAKSEMPSAPDKSENEGIQQIPCALARRLAPSFSLTEKLARHRARIFAARQRSHDEHCQTDILTPGIDLTPAFPVSRETSGSGSL